MCVACTNHSYIFGVGVRISRMGIYYLMPAYEQCSNTQHNTKSAMGNITESDLVGKSLTSVKKNKGRTLINH